MNVYVSQIDGIEDEDDATQRKPFIIFIYSRPNNWNSWTEDGNANLNAAYSYFTEWVGIVLPNFNIFTLQLVSEGHEFERLSRT